MVEKPLLRKLFYCYAIFGAIGTIENLVVLICLLAKSRLRKRYILICGLAGADFLISLGFFIGGVWRIYVLDNGHKNTTAKECMEERPFNWLFVIGEPLPNLIVLLIAVERLLATFMPLRYYHWPIKKYSLIAVCVFYAYTLLLLIIAFILPSTAFNGDSIVDGLCFTRDATGETFQLFNAGQCSVIGVITIIINLTTIAFLKRATAQLASTESVKKRRQSRTYNNFLERQIRITKLMTAIIALSFFFVVVPEISSFVVSVANEKAKAKKAVEIINDDFVPWIGVLVAVMAVLNPWLYTLGSRELRVEIWQKVLLWSCFRNKVLPKLHSMQSREELSKSIISDGPKTRNSIAPKTAEQGNNNKEDGESNEMTTITKCSTVDNSNQNV